MLAPVPFPSVQGWPSAVTANRAEGVRMEGHLDIIHVPGGDPRCKEQHRGGQTLSPQRGRTSRETWYQPQWYWRRGNSLLTTNLVALHQFFPPRLQRQQQPPAPELLLGQMVLHQHQFNVSPANKAQRGECKSSARPPFWIQMSVYQLAR